MQVINPFIREPCDPVYPGSTTPDSPRCVRGANTRYFDQALVNAGFPIVGGRARVEQINMIGTTNESRFDSLTTTLRGRRPWIQVSLSYVLASSRAWGGQPVASYSGNGIQITPENQFKPEEWGPTRLDERHRVVASGVFNLPGGLELSPVFQFAPARPYSLNVGFDLDGDNLAVIDRVCQGVDPRGRVRGPGRPAGAPGPEPPGLPADAGQRPAVRFVVDANGNIREISGRFASLDLRATRVFRVGQMRIRRYADLYNLLNTESLSLASRLGLSYATSRSDFMQPVSLFGPGFGPPVGRPFTAVVGARLDFRRHSARRGPASHRCRSALPDRERQSTRRRRSRSTRIRPGS